LPYIKTPIFPLQSKYDSWQACCDLDSKNATLINTYGASLTKSILKGLAEHNHNGIFLDSCFHHCGNWNSMHIRSESQASAFTKFYHSNGGHKKYIYEQNEAYPCDSCCK